MRIRQMLDSSDPAEAARAAVTAAKSILSTGTNTSPEVIARAKQLVAMGEAELAKQIRARRQRTPPQGGPAASPSPVNPTAYETMSRSEVDSPGSGLPAMAPSSAAPPVSPEVVTHEMTFIGDDLVLKILLQREDARGPLRDVKVDVRGARVVISALDSLGYRVARRVSFERTVPPVTVESSVRGSLVELRCRDFVRWAGLHSRVGVSPITVGDESVTNWLHNEPEPEAPAAPAAPQPARPAAPRPAAARTKPATPSTGFPAFGAPQAAPAAPPPPAPPGSGRDYPEFGE